jgi:UDP-GlcNAc:undecaprenyl-phosphate/decaprenyl-phosphate GlcNAc-1-phosphate transferase
VNLTSGLLCAAWLASFTGLLAVLVTPLFSALARRCGALDIPRERSLHSVPTPLLGGLAIVTALLVTTISHLAGAALIANSPGFLKPVFSNLDYDLPGLSATWGRLGIIFAGGVGMAALGFVDDRFDLRVRTRLFIQFAIATAVVGLGIRPALGFLPEPLPAAVGVIWLVGITNSFNLVDGVDGLATGLAAIASGILGAIMWMTNHPCTAALLFALCGACLGFLWHNWHPARVFLGSNGALFLGYMLGALTMIATFANEKTTSLTPIAIPLLVFAVPLYDTTSVILIRIGLRKPIWKGDLSHFHHRLLRIGFSQRQCVAFMYLIALAFGAGGILISQTGVAGNAVVLSQAAVLGGVIVLMERVVGRLQEASHAVTAARDQTPHGTGFEETPVSRRQPRATTP